MEWNDGLWLAARDHCYDTGPPGTVSHTGADGSSFTQRMDRHGSWSGYVGENLSFGPDDPVAIVMALFIDDGVPNRGHRTSILSENF